MVKAAPPDPRPEMRPRGVRIDAGELARLRTAAMEVPVLEARLRSLGVTVTEAHTLVRQLSACGGVFDDELAARVERFLGPVPRGCGSRPNRGTQAS